MLEGLSDLSWSIENVLGIVGTYIHLAADSIQLAGTTLYDEGHQYAGTKLTAAHVHLEFAAAYIGYGTLQSNRLKVTVPDAFDLIDTNWPEGNGNGEVTMDAILNAMLAAEYTEFQQFVGIVDGYRVALWDKWFNTEFYAALARGFKQLAP